MTVTRSRGAVHKVKKHKPILFGGTFVHLLIGPHNRKFSAHEDVLCSRSAYFKKRFQEVRKDIDGECAVCIDNLESVAAETVFCRTCGQNFHNKCMDQWLQTMNTCPTCRTVWKKWPNMRSSTLDQLDPEGFEVYVQWLYSHQIPSYGSDKDANARCIRMLKAHLLGNTIKDNDFLLAVRNEIVETAVEAGLEYSAIDFAYKNTLKPCSLRQFLVDLYALTGDAQSLKEGNVSHLFLIDMVQSFIGKSRNLSEGADVWSMLVAEGHIEGNSPVPKEGAEVEDGND
ncbi:hypothetical protein EKO04_000471 [Ascochyta lentis]|uniref:RING-type domain-containing protein n=1 Tax=Ascochyta lentis TaxID=205686 RepID=A0A8H7MN02_9PLEO|nr:hypothetical protein EKO04_000471 [Ascochyta lentis]